MLASNIKTDLMFYLFDLKEANQDDAIQKRKDAKTICQMTTGKTTIWLYHPLNGITNPNYILLRSLTLVSIRIGIGVAS